MQAVKFRNFTNEDFTWKFDGNPYTFAANSEIFLEQDKAEHFAKHLVDREMNRQKIVTDNRVKREDLLRQCFPTDEVVTPLEALQENKKVKKTKKAEVEFEDLEVKPKK